MCLKKLKFYVQKMAKEIFMHLEFKIHWNLTFKLIKSIKICLELECVILEHKYFLINVILKCFKRVLCASVIINIVFILVENLY